MYVKIAAGRVSTVYNNGAASANSSYNSGFAYDTTGKLQVNTAAVPTTKSFSNGIARHSDGVLCVNTHDPSIVPYAYLPGVNGNYFSTPDAAANQITGDLSGTARIDANSYTPAAAQALLAKDSNGAGGRAFLFYMGTDGKLNLFWSQSGNADGQSRAEVSSVAVGFSVGTAKYAAFSLDVDNGAAGTSVKFWTSSDNITYTQLGTTQTTAGALSVANVNIVVTMGAYGNGSDAPSLGKFYRGQLYNGIPPIFGGSASASPVVDFNAVDWSETTTNGTTQVSSTTGETWTLNNTGADPAMILGIARGQGGLFTDNSGALYVNVADAVTTAIAGVPVTAKGAVAVSAVT